MEIVLSFSSGFIRKLKKLTQRNPERKKRVQESLKLFRKSPFDPSLKSHKLVGGLKNKWSFSVEKDLRIIYFFEDSYQVTLIDIGSHDEVYGK